MARAKIQLIDLKGGNAGMNLCRGNNVHRVIDFLNNLPPQATGVLMAVFMACIRVIYDQKETKPQRIIVESMLCGALSLAATYGITAMGLSLDWAVFVGGTIGYLGPQSVREYVTKVLNKKTDDIK